MRNKHRLWVQRGQIGAERQSTRVLRETPDSSRVKTGPLIVGGWLLAVIFFLVPLRVVATGVATAEEDSPYYWFGEALAGLTGGVISTVVETNGSVDNLRRLNEGEVDLAIVQSDIAHYAFYGRRGFEGGRTFFALMPLFPEYVQIIVRRDSGFRIFNDLEGGTIGIGPSASGSQINALDVLHEAGLRRDVHYSAFEASKAEAIARLKAGELDAVFVTTAERYADLDADLGLIPVPRDIVTALSEAHPYYEPALIQGEPRELETLSVRAFLVVSDRLDTSSVASIVAALTDNWRGLSEQFPGIPSLEIILNRQPVPFHHTVPERLAELEIIEPDHTNLVVFLTSAILLVVVALAQKKAHEYDQFGRQLMFEHTIGATILRSISRGGYYLYVVLSVAFLLSGIVLLMQHFEASYATENNLENPFAFVRFEEALLWMFTFMSSGQSFNLYPVSPEGRILVAAVPVVGLTGLFGALLILTNRVQNALARMNQGLANLEWKDHVLICGWNRRVPGLIRILTSKNAPARKRVVVVAESESTSPLSEFEFNERNLVRYCRGDSADPDVLRRSNAAYASAAIVVAGVKKRANRNLGSALTVLSLKNLSAKHQRDIFVAAELLFEENLAYFDVCGADITISSDRVFSRIGALCCLYDRIGDFAYEILDYGGTSDVYSLPTSSLFPEKTETANSWSVGSAMNYAAGLGLNLVGFVASEIDAAGKASDKVRGAFADSGDGYGTVPQGTAILLSDIRNDYARGKKGIPTCSDLPQQNLEPLMISVCTSSTKRVVILGSLHRAKLIRAELEAALEVDVQVTIVTTEAPAEPDDGVEVGRFNDDQLWKAICDDGPVDRVLVLSHQQVTSSDARTWDKTTNEDVHTVLVAKAARVFCRAHGQEPRIIAEIENMKSAALFLDSEVQELIPTASIIDCIFSMLIYNRGKATKWLTEMLSPRSTHHLLSYRVREGDGFAGMPFSELIKRPIVGAKLLAWLPLADELGYLESSAMDSRRRDYSAMEGPPFITHSGARGANGDLSVGDLLILVGNPETCSQRGRGSISRKAAAI